MKPSVLVRLACVAACLLAMLPRSGAAEPSTLKMSTIAPKGSIYHRVLQDVGEAFRAGKGTSARAIVYPDGVQGTESDVVRRLRIGQLDAALLTVMGLKEIDASLTALQFMPMVFRSWEEVDLVRSRLRNVFEAQLAKKGFVVLFWGDAGWVHFFSKTPMSMPDDFKRARIFVWEGDGPQVALMKGIGYQPVGLPVADMLPSLETGMIDTVPMVPVWALAGQFDRVTPYMLAVKWVPIVGAAVMRQATFDALSPATRDAVMQASAKAAAQLQAHRVVQDEESLRGMQARGLRIQPATPEIEAAWRGFASKVWPQVRGTMVPAETFDQVQAILTEYRAGKRP